MMEGNFWRGFLPLLLAFAVAQFGQQVDMAMLAGLGNGVPAAYALLTRIAVPDLVLMMAMGSVVSVTVAAARREGDAGPAIRQALGLAAAAGATVGLFGLFAYPRLAGWLAGDGAITTMVGEAVFWFALAAPLRFTISAAVFILHALGEGTTVVRWRLSELALKAAANALFITGFGFGFAGCFLASLAVGAGSCLWVLHRLKRVAAGGPCLPARAWTLDFGRRTGWEAQRVLAIQLFSFAAVALFASSWAWPADVARLDAFAAGTALSMALLAPFTALTRFLAMRLAGRPATELLPIVRTLWLRGAPAVAAAAAGLSLAGDWLGRTVYGQAGPWWSVLVGMLALSLPLRYVNNVMRASLQGLGAFSTVAATDSATGWCIGLPLIAAGLYLNEPVVAYGYLLAPEAIGTVWLWRQLQPSRRGGERLESTS